SLPARSPPAPPRSRSRSRRWIGSASSPSDLIMCSIRSQRTAASTSSCLYGSTILWISRGEKGPFCRTLPLDAERDLPYGVLGPVGCSQGLFATAACRSFSRPSGDRPRRFLVSGIVVLLLLRRGQFDVNLDFLVAPPRPW